MLAENSQEIVCNGLSRCNDFHLNIISLKIVQFNIILKPDSKRWEANQWEPCQIRRLQIIQATSLRSFNSNQKHLTRCLFSIYAKNRSPWHVSLHRSLWQHRIVVNRRRISFSVTLALVPFALVQINSPDFKRIRIQH